MEITTILFVIRILSALLLLAFLGGMGWLIYRDMQATAKTVAERERRFGYLRVVHSGDDDMPLQTRFPLLPITTLGRAVSNTIVLTDDYASSKHAMLNLRGQQWWLEDLGSRNGTLLNDLPLEIPTVVSGGDVIAIGKAHLKIEFEDNAEQ
jgi:hypothetical protein